jgi:hypothetical protein
VLRGVVVRPGRKDGGVLVVVDLPAADVVDAFRDVLEEGLGLGPEGRHVAGPGQAHQLGKGRFLLLGQVVDEYPAREELVHQIELALEVLGGPVGREQRRPVGHQLVEIFLDVIEPLGVELVDGLDVERAPRLGRERRLAGRQRPEPLGFEAFVVALPDVVRGEGDDLFFDHLLVEVVLRDLVEQVVVDGLVRQDHPNAQLVAAGQVDLDPLPILDARDEARGEVRVVVVEEDAVGRRVGPTLRAQRRGVGGEAGHREEREDRHDERLPNHAYSPPHRPRPQADRSEGIAARPHSNPCRAGLDGEPIFGETHPRLRRLARRRGVEHELLLREPMEFAEARRRG